MLPSARIRPDLFQSGTSRLSAQPPDSKVESEADNEGCGWTDEGHGRTRKGRASIVLDGPTKDLLAYNEEHPNVYLVVGQEDQAGGAEYSTVLL